MATDPTPPASPRLAPPRPAGAGTVWDRDELDPDYPDLDGLDARGLTIDLAGARTLTVLRSRLVECTIDIDPDVPVALQDCELTGMDLTGWRIESMRRVRLERCRLAGVDAGDASMRDVTLADCAAELGSWRKATLERVVLRGGRIDGADLSGVRATDVVVDGVGFDGVTLDGFRAERVDLTGADLTHVDRLADLAGSTIDGVQAVALAARLAGAVGLHIATRSGP